MQITIDLPDNLTDKIQNEWVNLPQKIIANLVLDALREGLIDFQEMKEMLNFFSEAELKEFLKQKICFILKESSIYLVLVRILILQQLKRPIIPMCLV